MRAQSIAREAAVAALLGVAVLAFLGPALASGLTTYWSDLTYLHFGWRAGPAQLVQAGRAPLWEPALYFGMPMAGSMQGGLFAPAGMLQLIFGFATAVALYQIAHLFLGAWLCALWARSWGLRWGPAAGAGILYSLSGLMISRLPYLNHLGVLAWAPALALFFRRPLPLALVLALMLLAGYPTFVPGCALAAWAAAWAARRRVDWRRALAGWAAACAGAAVLAAVQLAPGLELAALSRRAAGVGLEEALIWSFSPRDLLQWIGPLAVGAERFKPADQWTQCVYLGAAGVLAIAIGALVLPRRRAAVLLAFVAGVLLLTLGSTNPLSAKLWEVLPPLRFVRYPGNLAYMALPALCALAGAGLGRRGGPVLALVLAVELVAVGRRAVPFVARDLFTDAGPLARSLQAALGETRYLISPRALQSSMGANAFDWKHRLYGLTNAPYRLRAAANFGEPLTIRGSYEVMDRLLSLPGAHAAALWLPWLGASRLLTPSPALSPALAGEGRVLWEVSRARRRVSIAQKLSESAGAALPEAWPAMAPEPGEPLPVTRPREDRFSVSGSGAGWLFVAEPLYPGWTARLRDAAGERDAAPERALAAFQKVRVPGGAWTVEWRYAPACWLAGLCLTALALLAFGGALYHRPSLLDS